MLGGKSIKVILQGVEELSNRQLNFKDDIEILLTISFKENKINLLEKLSFQAKFSKSLFNIIQKKESNNDEIYFERIKKEYLESILKVKAILEEILNDSEKFIKNIFSEKYLILTQQCMENINKLCSDLEYLKLYLNDLKRN
jgi:hypothetical protein